MPDQEIDQKAKKKEEEIEARVRKAILRTEVNTRILRGKRSWVRGHLHHHSGGMLDGENYQSQFTVIRVNAIMTMQSLVRSDGEPFWYVRTCDGTAYAVLGPERRRLEKSVFIQTS